MDGNPQLVLFDIGSAAWKMDDYKRELWDSTSIGIPHLDVETNDAIILGYQVAQFIEEVWYIYIFLNYLNFVISLYSFNSLYFTVYKSL